MLIRAGDVGRGSDQTSKNCNIVVIAVARVRREKKTFCVSAASLNSQQVVLHSENHKFIFPWRELRLNVHATSIITDVLDS